MKIRRRKLDEFFKSQSSLSQKLLHVSVAVNFSSFPTAPLHLTRLAVERISILFIKRKRKIKAGSLFVR